MPQYRNMPQSRLKSRRLYMILLLLSSQMTDSQMQVASCGCHSWQTPFSIPSTGLITAELHPHQLHSYSRENTPSGASLKSPEREDVDEVFRLLEQAGLEAMPNEKDPIPYSCPLLPSPPQLCPTSPEDVIEVRPSWIVSEGSVVVFVQLAFCCLGKSAATVEELQSIMKSWLEVTGKGPCRNPGLELWKGLDHCKVFAQQEMKGQESILTCLKKCTDRFQNMGLNENGKETWECIDLGFFNTRTTTTSCNDSRMPDLLSDTRE